MATPAPLDHAHQLPLESLLQARRRPAFRFSWAKPWKASPVTFAGFLGVGSPLLPLQILFINIVTDVFPALGVGRENASLMEPPPRDPKTPILDGKDWGQVVFYALAITFSVPVAYLLGTHRLGLGQDEGNNLSFYALSFAQVLHVFNLHSERSFFNNEITRNRYVWYATAVCLLIMVVTY